MVHSEPWTVTKYRGDTVKSINRPLAAVVYRSHAVSTLSPPQLDALTLAAQARNRCESITGLMVYADNCFFQWLEGPVDSVDRIMRSIMNDPRHTDIEILNNQLIHQRSFADWSMKLALPAREFVPWRGGILSPSRTIVDELRRRPDTAPSILLKMVPVRAGDPIAESVLHDAANQMPLKRSTAALLKRVIVSTVIPELVRQHRRREASQPVMAAHPRTSELADLLVGSDQQAAFELIKELHQGAQRRLPLFRDSIRTGRSPPWRSLERRSLHRIRCDTWTFPVADGCEASGCRRRGCRSVRRIPTGCSDRSRARRTASARCNT